MAVRDLQLGTVAKSIVIRGFGGGGHGGDLGAVVDGIPLNEAMSHADGYVDLNVLVPLEIDSLTVLKGPVSALYGNFNRGGLVNIQTRKTGDYAETDFTLGSHGTTDLQAAYGSAIGERQQLNLAAQLYRTDGYRPQSDTNRATASARWAIDATDDLQIALSARFLESDSRSASYVTRAQFDAGSIGIDPRTQNDGAEKDFLTLRADVNYQISSDLKLLSFAYTTQQEFTRWFTRAISAPTWRQREETYDRTVYGAGTSLNGLLSLAALPVRYVAGMEAFRESTEFKFFDGLDHRRRVTPALSDRDTKLNSVSAFTEVEASVHPLAKVSLGLRADRFTGGCERLGPETGTDPCGALNRASHLSPKLELTSQVTDWLQLRASWAEGFALANGFVKYSIGGEITPGHEAFGFQAQERRGERGDSLFVVGRAATEEKAVLLGEHERIPLPVLALRGDHVHVGKQQNGLAAGAITAIAHDQRGDFLDGQFQRQDTYVLRRKAQPLKSSCPPSSRSVARVP